MSCHFWSNKTELNYCLGGFVALVVGKTLAWSSR